MQISKGDTVNGILIKDISELDKERLNNEPEYLNEILERQINKIIEAGDETGTEVDFEAVTKGQADAHKLSVDYENAHNRHMNELEEFLEIKDILKEALKDAHDSEIDYSTLYDIVYCHERLEMLIKGGALDNIDINTAIEVLYEQTSVIIEANKQREKLRDNKSKAKYREKYNSVVPKPVNLSDISFKECAINNMGSLSICIICCIGIRGITDFSTKLASESLPASVVTISGIVGMLFSIVATLAVIVSTILHMCIQLETGNGKFTIPNIYDRHKVSEYLGKIIIDSEYANNKSVSRVNDLLDISKDKNVSNIDRIKALVHIEMEYNNIFNRPEQKIVNIINKVEAQNV